MPFGKAIVRTAVIGGLGLGTLAIVAGPDRVMLLAGQAHDFVTDRIDGAIEDPVALRAQLRELESAYPERISKVRGELASLDEQIDRLSRDAEIANRVTELAADDLDELQALLTAAEERRSGDQDIIIRVRHDGRSIDLDRAYTEATQLASTVSLYQDRATAAERDISLLNEQREHLVKLLGDLETERSQFVTQLANLEGQIEMIARNETLIDMLAERQKTIDELERFESASLDQVASRMTRIRAEQEAQLTSLTQDREARDYEAQAAAMLNREQQARRDYEQTMRSIERTPPTVTIDEGDLVEEIEDETVAIR
ncbi:MAG: hypothetical protein AAGB34_10085 [Planctomycetota bacterium]